MKRLILLLALPLSFQSCKSADPGAPTTSDVVVPVPDVEARSLTETRWGLIQFDGQDLPAMDRPSKTPYILLETEARRVTGFGGCNRFFGTYRLGEEGGGIEFSQMVSTRMACPDLPIDEGAFLALFTSVDSYVIDGDELRLSVEGGAPVAVFAAVAPDETE